MEQIVDSLADLDIYKIHMWMFESALHADTHVKWQHMNRTTASRIADYVGREELQEQLDAISELMFSSSEVAFLKGQNLYSSSELHALSELKLDHVEVQTKAGQFIIEPHGSWPKTTLWETIILAVLNELYFRALYESKGMSLSTVWAEGERRLMEKIHQFKAYQKPIRFVEFGTRRRFSRKWQKRVLEILLNEIPEKVAGTSNVRLAMEFGIPCFGTVAHEPFIVYSGIYGNTDEGLLASHNLFIRRWLDFYNGKLNVFPTDTWGSDFFYNDLTYEQALVVNPRPDSGDPFVEGEKAVEFYNSVGIGARNKVCVFADGLDTQLMFDLNDTFEESIGLSNGWGTNLTCDMGFGLNTVSQVMKPIEVDGVPVGKLTNNIAKATGPQQVRERNSRVFGHTASINVVPQV